MRLSYAGPVSVSLIKSGLRSCRWFFRGLHDAFLGDVVGDALKNAAQVKAVWTNSVILRLQRSYNLVDSHDPGLFGGMLNLKELRLGDVIEISVYVYMDGFHEAFRFRHVTGIEGVLQDPIVVIDEFWAPAGAVVAITQVGGQPKLVPFSIYRR